MDALRAALGNDRTVTLDAAALDIASIEYPSLSPQPSLAILDSMAARIDACAGSRQEGLKFIQAVNCELFEKAGLRGNDRDYYDVRNSCLNDVLDRRLGIPITLSVIYLEVARRLRRPVFGIGLPGHFIVQYDDDSYSTFIDPFHQGRLLSLEECLGLARDIGGVDPDPASGMWKPVGNRYILLRMLNNLAAAYSRAGQHRKAVGALDLLIEASPETAGYYRHRGMLHVHLKEHLAARRDLGKFLELAPDGADRGEVARQLAAIHRWLASVN